MEIKDVSYSKDKYTMSFVMKSSTAFANSLRRAITSLVPTLAIEEVEIFENSSALYDEVLAHRLGLVPLVTDLKAYSLPSEFPDDGVDRAECTVKLTLEAKGPCTVYASELKARDPKVICPFPKLEIVKLLKNQSIKIEAKAVLGQGFEHMKWSPGTAYYQHAPTVKAGGKANVVNTKHIVSQKSQEIFDIDGAINNPGVKVKSAQAGKSNSEILFTVESFGQLTPKKIVEEAIQQLNKQINELSEAANKI